MANNRLRALPEELGALGRLTMLDAGHNQIAELPRSFAKLVSLSDYLYLHDNRLKKLDDAVFEGMPELRYLNLGDNPLRGLPASLGALAKLEELRLENSGLKTLPGFLSSLAALDELTLRNNRLSALPPGFAKLGRLRQLDLRGNRFTRIPEVARALMGLRKLDLRWNDLRRIPSWVKDLRSRGCRVLL